MTQILAVVRPDDAYLASDSLWNCEASGRQNFSFRKVFSFGDHLVAACGHAAGMSMILEVGHQLPSLHAGDQHEAFGRAVRDEWHGYVQSFRADLLASGVAQTFVVLSRGGTGFRLTEWFGEPGEVVRPTSDRLRSRDFRHYGPLVRPPGTRAVDPYFMGIQASLRQALAPAADGRLAASAIERAIRSSVVTASDRGGSEARMMGLPMTGWRLPATGPPNPIGDRAVGGLEPDPRSALDAFLGIVPSSPPPPPGP